MRNLGDIASGHPKLWMRWGARVLIVSALFGILAFVVQSGQWGKLALVVVVGGGFLAWLSWKDQFLEWRFKRAFRRGGSK